MSWGRCTIEGFAEIDNAFQTILMSDRICSYAVEKAAPELVKAVRKAIIDTGGGEKLARSYTTTGPYINQWGAFAEVEPVGKDANGNDWAKRAAVREYGSTWPRGSDAIKIHHQKQAGQPKNAPRPFREKAMNMARDKCEQAMRDAVIAQIDKAWGG